MHLVSYCFTKWCGGCGQNIGLEPKRPRFNPLYQHVLCGVCIFVYIPCTCVQMYNTKMGCG